MVAFQWEAWNQWRMTKNVGKFLPLKGTNISEAYKCEGKDAKLEGMLISQLSPTYSTWVILKTDLQQECEHQIWGKTLLKEAIHC